MYLGDVCPARQQPLSDRTELLRRNERQLEQRAASAREQKDDRIVRPQPADRVQRLARGGKAVFVGHGMPGLEAAHPGDPAPDMAVFGDEDAAVDIAELLCRRRRHAPGRLSRGDQHRPARTRAKAHERPADRLVRQYRHYAALNYPVSVGSQCGIHASLLPAGPRTAAGNNTISPRHPARREAHPEVRMILSNVTGIGDPFVLRSGGVYYMYATSAPDGFRCFSSYDLENWTDLGRCYSGSPWGEDRFWAPEVYLRGGVCYMFYTAGWKKNHSLRIGLAVSESPAGPFLDVTGGPLFDCGCAAIDATVLFDGDRAFLYFVRDCSENRVDGVFTSVICGVGLDSGLTSLYGDPVELCRPTLPWEFRPGDFRRWNEGPAVIRRNGRYYMTYSANCYADRRYCIGCAESLSPLGPFVKYADGPVLQASGREFSGPGHNSFFEDGDGRLMTAFHIHARPDRPGGDRRACFAPVLFDAGGRLSIPGPGGDFSLSARRSAGDPSSRGGDSAQ